MRTIKFRWKTYDGVWVVGDLLQPKFFLKNKEKQHTKTWIVVSAFSNGGWLNIRQRYAVIPETVGQFTGLTDKNGKDIWEGDILARCFEDYNENCEVYYHKGVLSARAIVSNVFRPLNTMDGYGWCRVDCGSHYYDFRVIGNIHDNPELL